MIKPGIQDFTQPAADGWPLSMRLISAPEPVVAVLMSSATGFPKGFYERFARHLAGRGAAVLIYDYRGIAGSRPDNLAAMRMDYTDWGRLDMPAALDALIAAAPGLPVTHVGHSVGGHFLGFMPNQDRISRHAFIAVGSGYWGLHHPPDRWLELFFWRVLGPWSLARHGYVKSGRLWSGTDLPRGVFETWERWCLKPDYFRGELQSILLPNHYDAVTAPIRSWIFSDDPVANQRTGPELLRVYPNAPSEIVLRDPSNYGAARIGHDGAFRRGLEPLWDEVFDWLTS